MPHLSMTEHYGVALSECDINPRKEEKGDGWRWSEQAGVRVLSNFICSALQSACPMPNCPYSVWSIPPHPEIRLLSTARAFLPFPRPILTLTNWAASACLVLNSSRRKKTRSSSRSRRSFYLGRRGNCQGRRFRQRGGGVNQRNKRVAGSSKVYPRA